MPKVTVYVDEKEKTLLNSIEENLEQLFIVSKFEVAEQWKRLLSKH